LTKPLSQTVDNRNHKFLIIASDIYGDVVLESGSVLESDSRPYFVDSDLDSNPLDSDSNQVDSD